MKKTFNLVGLIGASCLVFGIFFAIGWLVFSILFQGYFFQIVGLSTLVWGLIFIMSHAPDDDLKDILN